MYFDDVETWLIPEAAFVDSLREMALDGVYGNEGIVLWLGTRSNRQARVTHLVALRGPEVIKEPAFLRIAPSLLNEITDRTISLGVALIGQIHSHGHLHGTNLSTTDRRYGFAVPHYLSIVAPDYAQRTDTTIRDCGVFVFRKDAGYIKLSPAEVSRRLQIIRNGSLPMIYVGGGL
jgi:hypothetical protein